MYYFGMWVDSEVYYHYNKPASLKAGKPQISLHYQKACHLVDALECNVPCQSKINKIQPRFVMKGAASNITIENGKGIIV